MAETKTEAAPAKPGYKTTEFWLTLAAVAVGALLASGVVGDESMVAKIAGVAQATLAQLGYTWSRGSVKAAAALPAAPEKK